MLASRAASGLPTLWEASRQAGQSSSHRPVPAAHDQEHECLGLPGAGSVGHFSEAAAMSRMLTVPSRFGCASRLAGAAVPGHARPHGVDRL